MPILLMLDFEPSKMEFVEDLPHGWVLHLPVWNELPIPVQSPESQSRDRDV